LTSFRLRQNGGCFDYLEIKVLEVVSKCQIAFESPACQRDFASDPLLKVLNKRSPMKKRSPPQILADEHLSEVCNPPRILADHWDLVRRRRIETTSNQKVDDL
jgi:hypothetical protein